MLKARLSNGVLVGIRHKGEGNSGLGPAELGRLLASKNLAKADLTEFLRSAAPVVIPTCEPCAPIYVDYTITEEGVPTLFYELRDAERAVGFVVLGSKEHRSDHSEDAQRAIDKLRRYNDILGGNYVVPRDGSAREIKEICIVCMAAPVAADYRPPGRFRLYILPWQEIILRLKASRGECSFEVVLDVIVEASRRLLSLIAREIELLIAIDDRRFEELVATLLSDLGFDEVELTPPRRDGGRDVVIVHRNRQSGCRETYLVECKHWLCGTKVSVRWAVHLLEVVAKERATGGVLLSSSGFGPKLLELEAIFRGRGIALRSKVDLEKWLSAWQRTYGSPLLQRLDPAAVLELSNASGQSPGAWRGTARRPGGRRA